MKPVSLFFAACFFAGCGGGKSEPQPPQKKTFRCENAGDVWTCWIEDHEVCRGAGADGEACKNKTLGPASVCGFIDGPPPAAGEAPRASTVCYGEI